jgi:hypothetical protein
MTDHGPMGAMAGRDDCGEARGQVERRCGAFLARYGFAFAGCASFGTGQNLSWQAIYASGRCQALFEFEDGAYACALGAPGTPPPRVDVMRSRDGGDGWYDVTELVHFTTGRRVLSRRVLRRLLAGKVDQLAWLGGVLEQDAGALLGLFAPARPAWREQFMRHRTRRR